jgi:hypothetical protein
MTSTTQADVAELIEQLYHQADRRHGSVGALRSIEWKAADTLAALSARLAEAEAENSRLREALVRQADRAAVSLFERRRAALSGKAEQ